MEIKDIPVSNRLPEKPDCNGFLVALFIPFLFAIIFAHFTLVAKIAHSMWDPTQFPEWLKVIDIFFVYHIHAFVQFIQIVLWLLVVAITGFIVFSVVFFPATMLGKKIGGDDAVETVEKSFWVASKFMFLPIVISLTTLAIIPAQAMRKPSETILEEGQAMQFVEFLDYISKASYFIFIVVLLFAVLFWIVGLMIRFLPDSKGFWQLPIAIVISLAVSIGAAIGFLALMQPIQSKTYGYSSLLFMLAIYSVISVIIVAAKSFKFKVKPSKPSEYRDGFPEK